MKTNRIITNLSAILLLALLIACSGGEEIPNEPEKPDTEVNTLTMEISPDTLKLAADGKSEGTFRVKLSKSASFLAKAENDWCILENTDGFGKDSYSVTAKATENPESKERISKISFHCGEITQYAYVLQEAQEEKAQITISPDTLYLEADKGSQGTVTVNLPVSTNEAPYRTGENSWFKQEIEEEEDGKALKITYTALTEWEKDYSCDMWVMQNGLTGHFMLYQKAKKEEENMGDFKITITPESQSVSTDFEQVFFLVDIDKETSISVSSDVSWCTPLDGNFDHASTQFKLYVNMDANNGNASRTATLTVKAGNTTKSCTITQEGKGEGISVIGGTIAEAVDLGLSVLWASHNLGASSETEAGVYLAWGELYPKEQYKEETYQFFDEVMKTYDDFGDDISETLYDAAYIHWDNEWQLPTMEECNELINNCEWEWCRENGINGYRVKGKNGNSIFLPAKGRIGGKNINDDNENVHFWTATVRRENIKEAYALNAHPHSKGYLLTRVFGIPIRPVKAK